MFCDCLKHNFLHDFLVIFLDKIHIISNRTFGLQKHRELQNGARKRLSISIAHHNIFKEITEVLEHVATLDRLKAAEIFSSAQYSY
jgi:hypothetical protein